MRFSIPLWLFYDPASVPGVFVERYRTLTPSAIKDHPLSRLYLTGVVFGYPAVVVYEGVLDGTAPALALYWIFVALGAATLLFQLGSSVLAQTIDELRRFEPTPGSIVAVSYNEDARQPDQYAEGDFPHVAEITYRYTVDDTEYTRQRLLPGPATSGITFVGSVRAKQFLRKYRPEMDVTVYVDPDDSSKAFLDRTLPKAIPVLCYLGSLLFLATAVFVVQDTLLGLS
jgi:hypothetical protein